MQFQLGSRAAQNWFGDGCSFAGYDHSVPTVHAYETVENGGVWEEGDARKVASLRYDFSYNGVEPDLSSLTWEGLSEEDHDELKPHIKKYEDFRTDVASGLEVNNMWLSGKNIPVLRYADVLLCYAECLNELGQTAKAETYVNQVRDRAFGGSQPSDLRWSGLSQTEFREKMQDERIRELFGENKHEFTGVDYVEYYGNLVRECGAECEIIFANQAKTILNYTDAFLLYKRHFCSFFL